MTQGVGQNENLLSHSTLSYAHISEQAKGRKSVCIDSTFNLSYDTYLVNPGAQSSHDVPIYPCGHWQSSTCEALSPNPLSSATSNDVLTSDASWDWEEYVAFIRISLTSAKAINMCSRYDWTPSVLKKKIKPMIYDLERKNTLLIEKIPFPILFSELNWSAQITIRTWFCTIVVYQSDVIFLENMKNSTTEIYLSYIICNSKKLIFTLINCRSGAVLSVSSAPGVGTFLSV